MNVLALSAMGAGWQAALYIAAVACFVVAAFVPRWERVNLIALGLALFVFAFAWNAAAAA